MRKTEAVRTKGFRTSILSFFVAIAFLVGASRINESFSIYPYLMMGGCLLASVVVLVVTLRRSSTKRSSETEKDEDD